jgi:hypothetical protein
MNGAWDDDELLAADLAEAMTAAARVPDRFVRAGKAAFGWRTVDAELAQLSFDSAGAASEGTRAETAVLRAMTFAASQVAIEIEVTADGLLGQIVPPQQGELDLRWRDGTTRTVPVDEVGWFRIGPRPTGLFRLYLRTASGLSVCTEWVTL